MLPALRDSRGRPNVLLRVLAGLVVLGMLAIAAPAVIPVLRWLVNAVS